MHVIIVGADLEENLGVGMVAATAEAAGHRVVVAPYWEACQLRALAEKILAAAPDVVGLSIQFQHRAAEFLGVARYLRALGYGGHITCGGQLSTLAYHDVLDGDNGVDSVVLHDGEETFVALLDALSRGEPLERVAGLALRGPDGEPVRTPVRPSRADLDGYPFPKRYRQHARHVGVPFIPILGSRGCWGDCAFCSISAFHRGAQREGGGPLLRLRSPQNVAAEMAGLWRGAGGRAVFCFHDDTLLLPRPERSLARLRAIRAELDRLGVGPVGIIGKARPDCLTPDLALELRALGVVRLFVGVENGSQDGADRLGRRVTIRQIHEALEACRQAGIFCCYNLLMFEPGATLEDIEENTAFIREHAYFPVNFCRAEAYSGTRLQRELAERGNLQGDYLGFDYRIEDDRTEALFRVTAAAFRQRNFARRGVHNRYMGLGYSGRLLEDFYPELPGRAELVREAEELTRAIALETAAFLDEALALVRGLDLSDRDCIEREALHLGLRVAEADSFQHARLDRVFEEMDAYAARAQVAPATRRGRVRELRDGARQVARAMALAGALGVSSVGVLGCDDRPPVSDAGPDQSWGNDDAAPWPDGIYGDSDLSWGNDDAAPWYYDMWGDSAPDSGVDSNVVDPPPPDWGNDDAPSPDVWPVDPPPSPDASSPQGALDPRSMDHWTDTSPRLASRTRDLPLFAPPHVTLVGVRDGEGIRVSLRCPAESVSVRWEAEGAIEADGREARWTPSSDDDQIRVGVRSRGGVAVVALRARDVANHS